MKYETIIYLQGHEAIEVETIFNEKGADEAIKHLLQWDYGDGGEETDSEPWGTACKLYAKNDLVMNYNTGLPYFGLTRIKNN